MEAYTSEISWSDLVDAGLVAEKWQRAAEKEWVSY